MTVDVEGAQPSIVLNGRLQGLLATLGAGRVLVIGYFASWHSRIRALGTLYRALPTDPERGASSLPQNGVPARKAPVSSSASWASTQSILR